MNQQKEIAAQILNSRIKSINTGSHIQDNMSLAVMALSLATEDAKLASVLVDIILETQWKNGLIPSHAIRKNTFPDFVYFDQLWNSKELDSLKPNGWQTTHLVMPSILAVCVEKIYQQVSDKDEYFQSFFTKVVPKLIDFQLFLYNHRDPIEEGIIIVNHPWESASAYANFWDNTLIKNKLDKNIADNHNQHFYITSHYPDKHNIDWSKYLPVNHKDLSFCSVQCPLFNALFCWSNESIIKLYKFANADLNLLIDLNELTVYSMNDKLYCDEMKIYRTYDCGNERFYSDVIRQGILPILCDIPTLETAEKLLFHLQKITNRFGNSITLCPYDLKLEEQPLIPKNLEVNVFENWLLLQGLNRFEMNEMYDIIYSNTIDLLKGSCSYESYSCAQDMVDNNFEVKTIPSTMTAAIYYSMLNMQ